eukprot:Skav216384  [mRNA]  locus=scaffold1241:173022:184190:+ [translate_table: standard]
MTSTLVAACCPNESAPQLLGSSVASELPKCSDQAPMAAVYEEHGPAYVSVGDVFTSPPLAPKSWPAWGEAATESLNSLVFPGLDFSGFFGTPNLADLGFAHDASFAPKLGVGFPTSRGLKETESQRVAAKADSTEGDKGSSKDLLKRQLKKTQLCMFWKRPSPGRRSNSHRWVLPADPALLSIIRHPWASL